MTIVVQKNSHQNFAVTQVTSHMFYMDQVTYSLL